MRAIFIGFSSREKEAGLTLFEPGTGISGDKGFISKQALALSLAIQMRIMTPTVLPAPKVSAVKKFATLASINVARAAKHIPHTNGGPYAPFVASAQCSGCKRKIES